MAESSNQGQGGSRCKELERRIAELEARVRDLERMLSEAVRAGKRQTAPFSQGEPKAHPKPPGRKPGDDYGTLAFRVRPEDPPDQIIDVSAAVHCSSCGGRVRETHIDQQFQIGIPRRALLRRFDLHIGVCACCGKRVQPRHALQTSDALGAAAVHFGPDAQALIALLKSKIGLSYGDITGLFQDAFGIQMSRAVAARAVRSAGDRAQAIYHAIKRMIPQRDTVHPDETGRKVGGRLHGVWDFVTPGAPGFTLYVIRPSRGVDVPAEVLGMNYDGRLVHDGWAPHDQFTHDRHQQCRVHLLRRANELIERLRRSAAQGIRRIKVLLQYALDLRDRHRRREIGDHGFAVARRRLEKRLDCLLEQRSHVPDSHRLLKHLLRHRDQLLTFLYENDLEARNWPSEQAIRPTVVNRKVFGRLRREGFIALTPIPKGMGKMGGADFLSPTLRSWPPGRFPPLP